MVFAKRFVSALFCFISLFSGFAYAADAIRWDFNNPQEIVSAGNFEKWQVQDGLFTGKTKWDPILGLSLPKEGVDAAKLNFLTVRLYSSGAASPIEIVYQSPNKNWSLGRSFPVVPGWAVYTIDLNKVNWTLEGSGPEAQVWGGREKKVSTLRFDPGNEANRDIIMDWMELSGVEGKTDGVKREPSPEETEALNSLRWVFSKDGSYLGWSADNFAATEVVGGVLKGKMQPKGFSFLVSPTFSLSAEEYPVFAFRARTACTGYGNVYFVRAGKPLADNCYVPFYLIGDNQFHTYQVEMTKNKEWTGTITALRFDFCYIPDAEFEISEFKFLKKTEKP